MWSCHELRNTCLCCTYEEGWIQLGVKVSNAFSSVFLQKKKKKNHISQPWDFWQWFLATLFEMYLSTWVVFPLGLWWLLKFSTLAKVLPLVQNITAALVLFLLNYYIQTVHLTKQSLRRAIWNTITSQWYISNVGSSRAWRTLAWHRPNGAWGIVSGSPI